MDLFGDIKLFKDLAQHGSFSAAARRRGQEVSSLSRRLDRLEQKLGQRLFNRTPSGLVLTQAGERKLQAAGELIASARAFTEENGADDAFKGHISLAAPAWLGDFCIAPVVAEFLTAHPGLTMEMHLTNTVQDLDLEQIDVAVRAGGDSSNHYIVRKIAPNRRILAAAPDYLDARPPIKHPADLKMCEGLYLGAMTRWTLQGPNGETMTASPKRRLSNISGDALAAFCAAGLGVMLKSEADIAPLLHSGRLRRVLPEWAQSGSSDIVIVTPSRRMTPKAVQSLAAALEKGVLAYYRQDGMQVPPPPRDLAGFEEKPKKPERNPP